MQYFLTILTCLLHLILMIHNVALSIKKYIFTFTDEINIYHFGVEY